MTKKILLIFLCLIAITLTLTACEDEEYIITFDSQGGSKVQSVTVTGSGTIPEPEAPTKDGYEFIGWFIGPAQWNFDTIITSNITLKAKWVQKNYYYVSFNTDGAGTIDSMLIEEGQLASKPEDPVKEGYVFDGWYLGTDRWSFADSGIYADIELKARWKALYSVTFDDDNGGIFDRKVIDGNKITKPDGISRDGYILIGWYLGDTKWDFANHSVNGNITLKARWDINRDELVPINFDTDIAGITYEQIIVDHGATIPVPADPELDGYAFLGWYLDDYKWNFEEDLATEEITLTAKWGRYVTVTFMYDEETFTEDQDRFIMQITVIEGMPISSSDAPKPVKSGYTLTGWVYNGRMWNFKTDVVEGDIVLITDWIEGILLPPHYWS